MQADLICLYCKHFDINGFKCKAFPKGLPPEIISGENNHSKPLPKQGNEIVFEPIKVEKAK
jgi:hypothetical protein